MWMKALGRSKAGLILSALWLLVLQELPPFATRASGQSSLPAPPPPAAPKEVLLTGRLFCSLRRPVILFFPGVITALMVQPGQWVEAGAVLARYRLLDEVALQIHRRLNPPQIKELEARQTGITTRLLEADSKYQSLKQLAQSNLASIKSFQLLEREKQELSKEQASVRDQLRLERQLHREDVALLRKQLGTPVSLDQPPTEAALVAPIAGYVLWIHPELRKGAEFRNPEVVMQVGRMDPMILRAQAYEIEALQMKVGDRAQVIFDSLSGEKFAATVSRVSYTTPAATLEQPTYYDVEFLVDNPQHILREGLKGRIVLEK